MADPAADDRELIEDFRRGDRAAFELLVRRHQKVVWAVVRRFTRDGGDVDDLAQRTFIAALEHIGELRGAFRPWLLRIAANLSRNHLRANRRLVPLDLDPVALPLRSVETSPEETVDRTQVSGLLRSAIATLSARQRDVVLLRIDGDLPFAEIAETLGITDNNARVTFHTALQALRGRLASVADPSAAPASSRRWSEAVNHPAEAHAPRLSRRGTTGRQTVPDERIRERAFSLAP